MNIPIPQGMEQAPVTWTLAHTTGRESLAGARGFVRFEPTAVAVALPSMTVLPRPVEARVVGGVMEPVELMVNDPGLWNWRVIPEVGVSWAAFHVDVLGPVDLATVAVVPGKGPIRAVTGPPGNSITGITVEGGNIVITWDGGDPVTLEVPDVTGLATRLAALEYDSGWRDVSADLLYGATGTLHIRRAGHVVHWRVRDLVPGTAHAFYWPPAGMAAPSDRAAYPADAPSEGAPFYRDNSGRICRSASAAPAAAGRWWEGTYVLPPDTPPPATPFGKNT